MALSNFFFNSRQKEKYSSLVAPTVQTSTNYHKASINFYFVINSFPSATIRSCYQSFSTINYNYSLSISGRRIIASNLCFCLYSFSNITPPNSSSYYQLYSLAIQMDVVVTQPNSFIIYSSPLRDCLASIFYWLYISKSPSRWQGWRTSTSLERLNISATDCGPSIFRLFSIFLDDCLDFDIIQILELSSLILYLFQLMSAELLKKIELSRGAALEKGRVVKLRREDVDKTKLLGAKFTYSWYQTPAKVGIEIPYVVDKKDDLVVKFDEDRVTIDFPIKERKEKYHLDLILFKPIVPVRSKAIHRLDSIEIVMEKHKQSDNWLFLRRDGIGIPEAAARSENLYPSSSKQKKNWDKIDKEIEGDILKHGEEYGEDPSMNFFKQIFAQGDQQKRKAMMKSFQTSGGTVLSTDWGDVAKKDYEGKDRPSPPKGQEWRKREI